MVEAMVQQDHQVKLQVGKHTSQHQLQQRTAPVSPQGVDSGERHKQCRVGAQEACKRTNAIVLMLTISLPAWPSWKSEEAIRGIIRMFQPSLLKSHRHLP